MQNDCQNLPQDDAVPFTQEELQEFLDNMFASYIIQPDYDGWVGNLRAQHFRMYRHLQNCVITQR